MTISAVLFDLGGVVLGSPLHEIVRFEREHGIAPGLINRVVMSGGLAGAWSRRERGEIDFDAFCTDFAAECALAGGQLDVAELMRRIDEVTVPRPRMLAAIESLRSAGFAVAALTNNFEPLTDEAFKSRFDAVIESSIVGVRKPQPGIYEIALEALSADAGATAFLDDIGANLKTARAMGMTTIKVTDPDLALGELATLVGLAL